MLKSRLREEFLEKRSKLKEKEARDEIICRKILAMEEYQTAKVVAGFYPVGSEVNITAVLKEAMENRILLLPVCISDGIMQLRRVTSFDRLEKGKFNIPEPGKDCELFEAESVDFMLVPGLAFDSEGNRIGYGGGYYDRIICRLSESCITCGVGYSVQYTNRLPSEKYDMKIKKFISEA